MSIPATIASVCFITSHIGPATHFAACADALSFRGHTVQIYASGPALKRLNDLGCKNVTPFSIDNMSSEEENNVAEQLAKTCAKASFVLTDIGHIFNVKLHQQLKVHATDAQRFAYYDNPEPYVPGGYSKVAATIMREAQGILFANEKLATEKIYSEPEQEVVDPSCRLGIGYYPTHQAEKLAQRRKQEHELFRSEFFTKNGIADTGQKVLVYFGGNNDVYFNKAFPAFLNLFEQASTLTDLQNYVIVLQQHPGAKAQNLDGKLAEESLKIRGERGSFPKIVISDFSSDDAQILADAAFYYQTSMGPQFVLVGIPPIQIGHDTYEDVLIRNHLAESVTTPNHLVDVIGKLASQGKEQTDQKLILDRLGIREDWVDVLEQVVKHPTI